MVIRHQISAAASAAVLLFSASLFAQGSPAEQKPRKLSDGEKKEIQLVLKMVDEVAAGQTAPNDLSLTWVREDLLKAQGNKQYLPFSVLIDPSKVTGGKVSMYWRVVAKNAAAAEPSRKTTRRTTKTRSRNTPTRISIRLPSRAGRPVRPASAARSRWPPATTTSTSS